LQQQRGIEANPKKCKAIIEMCSPTNIKEVQRLVGHLTAISRFLPKLANKTRPMIHLLKKSAKFAWNDECKHIFQALKTTLASPSILQKPNINLPLIVYITATEGTVSAAITQESVGTQYPIYFVSRSQQDPETIYHMVEEMALSLVNATRRLNPTFRITKSS